MNTKTGLIVGGWAVTCAAAFFAGQTSDSPDSADSPATEKAPVVSSSRGSDRGNGSSRRRSNSSSSFGIDPESRSARIRAEAKELKQMSDPIARAQGFLDFVRDLAPGEFLDAVDAFRDGGIDNEQFGEYRLLLTAWAEIDPVGALTYASENTGTPFARQTILASWAKSTPSLAINWARDNFDNKGDESRANPWLVGVIEGLAPADPAGATVLLEELPFSRERGEALDMIFSQISALGTDATKSWVANLADERLKAGAAARLAGTLAEQDPLGALEWAASMGEDTMNRATGEIMDRWAKQDLPAARSWIDGQPETIVAAAGPGLVNEMIDQGDINGAADWLGSFEGNPQFDDTIRSFAYNAIGEEPTVAANWIMKITDERERTRTFHRVLGGWMQRDRAGAMDYINNNPVPESIKNRASGEPQR